MFDLLYNAFKEAMGNRKYRCNLCGEIIELLNFSQAQDLECPRCGSEDVEDYDACSLEVSSPPWEYQCPECDTRFRVTAPRGPDEAKAIKCPVCHSKNTKWISLSTAACATGG